MHVALSSHPRDCTLGHNLTVSGRTCFFQVFEVSGFLREEECDFIVQDAKPRLTNSGVATKDSDIGIDASTWRISEYYCT